jgi:hypothetical protein
MIVCIIVMGIMMLLLVAIVIWATAESIRIYFARKENNEEINSIVKRLIELEKEND